MSQLEVIDRTTVHSVQQPKLKEVCFRIAQLIAAFLATRLKYVNVFQTLKVSIFPHPISKMNSGDLNVATIYRERL